ncbi:MAG: bifunctional DNA primase/polymerase [Candidatus Pacebacteria bacterium]|nr:bifunctional DNA primase/polymerase [Candidatus Paceibacterota bacterium]
MSPENKKTNLDWALHYLRKGFSIIPVQADKKPFISWAEFQSRFPTQEEINNWWTVWPNAGIAIVTGKISGVVVVDVEKDGNSSGYLPTVAAKTGGGGMHFYYKHPSEKVSNGTRVRELTDIRGDGGYVVAPPSVSTKGEYEWLISPDDSDFSELPEWVVQIRTQGNNDKKWLSFKDGAPKGLRNDTAASMAGRLLFSAPVELWESVGWKNFKVWNSENIPPMSEKELRGVWESIKKYHINKEEERKEKATSQADKIVSLVLESPDILLFCSELDEPYIQFPVDNHKEYYVCRSKKTKMWLGREYWKKYSKTPNNDAISTALNTVEGHAAYEGNQYELENRVNQKGDSIFYFLSDSEWQSVKISATGWTIEKNPPILFRTYNHQQPQVTPVLGGDIFNLFSYINIEREDHKLLLAVWLICCFIPGFPHPMIYFHGPQGSAKSTVSKILKKIIDPSKIDGSDFPKDQKELIQQLAHHWFLVFDNITIIPSELSDILCRAVTGSGFSKRELYSDDSDIIYNFKRCISLNGINLPSLKPDLLERSVLVDLARIPKGKRKEEKDMLDNFTAELPSLLGSIFTVLSKAMEIRPTVKETNLPRMADFTLWGCAIAEALGHSRAEFLRAYTQNINLQSDEVINDNLEASFIVEFMADKEEWSGSATELLAILRLKYIDDWRTKIPDTPQVFSRNIMALKTTLEEVGIYVEREGGQHRKITIRKIKENIAPIASSLQDVDLFHGLSSVVEKDQDGIDELPPELPKKSFLNVEDIPF